MHLCELEASLVYRVSSRLVKLQSETLSLNFLFNFFFKKSVALKKKVGNMGANVTSIGWSFHKRNIYHGISFSKILPRRAAFI